MPPLIGDASAVGNTLRGVLLPDVASSETVQLRNLIERWARERLKSAAVPESLYDEFLALVEPPFLEAALRKHHGQCASAARALGIHRTTLKKKLDQYGIAGEE
jgi:DNA-binding protein Fis